jgi:hypothetical protein
MNGWNAVMRSAVARGEVDTTALRAKVTSLEGAKARFGAEPGFSFPADGSRVADPSGRWEAAVDECGTLNVGKAGAADLNWASIDVRGATCVFADGGSTLCVRRADEWRIEYETFDLERRITLQEFHEDTGKPRPST